ncbi:MAG: ATP-binding cassette domain-containing protein [Gammaproteobacteria bacterium]|nr:ATP-binding cassette domain-containing protein [Gammaproteobacteria bacterium]
MKKLLIKELYYHHCGPVNLQINAGDCVAVSGVSGSGKSLLLRALADLDEHRGSISLDDILMTDLPAPEWRKKVALLPAESQWWFDTLGEHFPATDNEMIHYFGFPDNVMSWSVSRLSSGEKQRFALLRLLLNKPDVLLLDEPTANLDNTNTLLFEKLIEDYIKVNSACVIWVSHDAQQLSRICNVHYQIENGQLLRQ